MYENRRMLKITIPWVISFQSRYIKKPKFCRAILTENHLPLNHPIYLA